VRRWIVHEIALLINRGIGLGDNRFIFLLGSKVLYLICYDTLFHLSVWGFDKSEIVNLGVYTQEK
jgi:hypothetical protein